MKPSSLMTNPYQNLALGKVPQHTLRTCSGKGTKLPDSCVCTLDFVD